MADDRDPPPGPPSDTSLAKQPKDDLDKVVDHVRDSLRSDSVNVVVVRMAESAPSATDARMNIEKFLAVQKDFDEHELKLHKERVRLQIEARREVAEIDERKQDGVSRRSVLSILGSTLLLTAGGLIWIAAHEGSLAQLGALLGGELLLCGVLGVIASGGRLTGRDVTSMISAVRGKEQKKGKKDS